MNIDKPNGNCLSIQRYILIGTWLLEAGHEWESERVERDNKRNIERVAVAVNRVVHLQNYYGRK
jgi:hypothetical protein